jgi:nicotinamide phosphoribosyltransferase
MLFDYPIIMGIDYYKIVPVDMYPEDFDTVTSYWTPRKSRIEGQHEVVVFGLQHFVQEYLIDRFDRNFFKRDIDEVISQLERYLKHTFYTEGTKIDLSHVRKLHALQQLPLIIRGLPEGTLCPIGVPMFSVQNTHGKDFVWVVTYVEDLISSHLWHGMTSATQGYRLRQLADEWYEQTVDGDISEATAMGDFSLRGQTNFEAAMLSSAGFLLSFRASSNMLANWFLEKYYGADIETEIVGKGMPSTEHSVMCSYGKEGEHVIVRKILARYPTGPVSIVGDAYDYWNFIETVIGGLKDEILSRDGTVFVRGDSGDPVDVITGDPSASDIRARKGTMELLWDMFGGTTNDKGYKVLDPHIRCIYGDGITHERAQAIYTRLATKGFASNNVALGIGAFTMQYNTRDTFGFALKMTHATTVNGEDVFIYKDPITDQNSEKKSHKGLCLVADTFHTYVLNDQIDCTRHRLSVRDQLTKQQLEEEAGIDLYQMYYHPKPTAPGVDKPTDALQPPVTLNQIRKLLHEKGV